MQKKGHAYELHRLSITKRCIRLAVHKHIYLVIASHITAAAATPAVYIGKSKESKCKE